MARDKGQIYEASDWFKMALQIDQVMVVHTYMCTLPLYHGIKAHDSTNFC